MTSIEIVDGETVSVKRIARDGNADTGTDMPDVEETAFGSATVVEVDELRGRRSVVQRNWYCPRGADVQQGDRLTRANGEVYTVISDALGDNDHPLTGDDLGVKYYLVRRVNAPRG